MTKRINLSLKEGYLDMESFLLSFGDAIENYDFLLLHCYAHIKNEEIYLEIDKDIYEHVVIYEGRNFLDAVKQYFFTLKRGIILGYRKGDYPIVKMNEFVNSYDDYPAFKNDVDKLIGDKQHSPVFLLSDDEENPYLDCYTEEISSFFLKKDKK